MTRRTITHPHAPKEPSVQFVLCSRYSVLFSMLVCSMLGQARQRGKQKSTANQRRRDVMNVDFHDCHQKLFLDRAPSRQSAVLLAARSAVLDRRRRIGGLLWSADVPPRRNTYFLLACYLKTSHQCPGLCVRWADVWMTCTVVRPTAGSFKTRKQLITAVSPSLHPQTLR